MSGYAISVVVFLVAGLALGLLTLWSRRSHAADKGFPVTFTNLVQAGASLPGGRAVLFASWCWVSWHFLSR